jgi:hypothetical protein
VAAADRSDTEEVEPERRLARLIVERLDLVPPVPVEELVGDVMDVAYEAFPQDCDAVVVGLARADARPQLFVNRGRSPGRQRFTLAHELGHLKIPWHLGTIVCHTNVHTDDDHSVYRDEEQQADRFASEILLPRRFLARNYRGPEHVPQLIAAATAAEVSSSAAAFAISDFLPSGHVLAIADAGDRIDYIFRSDGTAANLPYRRQILDRAALNVVAAAHAVVPVSGRSVEWWYFEQAKPLLEVADARTTTEILRSVLADVISDDDEKRTFLERSIPSVTGSAFGQHVRIEGKRMTAEELHALLRARFAGRHELRGVLDHPDFALYLSRRAEELSARQQA